jgi:hypothetical protein
MMGQHVKHQWNLFRVEHPTLLPLLLAPPHSAARDLLLDERIERGRSPRRRALLDVGEECPDHGRIAHRPPQRVRGILRQPAECPFRGRREFHCADFQRLCGRGLVYQCHNREVIPQCARLGYRARSTGACGGRAQ